MTAMSPSGRRRSRRNSVALIVVMATVGFSLGSAGCSKTDTASGDPGNSPSTGEEHSADEHSADEHSADEHSPKSRVHESRGHPDDVPAAFQGTDADFYLPPDPLQRGEPGELIRVMELGSSDAHVSAKLMYHTRDARNRDRVATAVVTYPRTEAPEGGWPVIATAPGTTGLSAHCGISHQISEAPGWGVEGVRVITDYIGLGPVGGPPQAYLSRPDEAHSVIDAVRAARNLLDAAAGTRWLSVGHSQGGHAALSAAELSDEYAPELDLVATLALAPASMLDRVYGGIDPIVTAILTAMALYGGAAEHPDIKVGDYVTPELAAASSVFETGCLDEITDALIPLATSSSAEGPSEALFTADPRHTDPARSILLANDVGKVAVAAPLFLVSGTADDRVKLERVRDLFTRLCAAGQVTELLIVDGATHDTVIPRTAATTAAWLNARLAGDEPTDSCTELGSAR